MRLYQQIGRMFAREGIENDARFLRAMRIYIAITVIFVLTMAAVIVVGIVMMHAAGHH